MPVEHAFSRLRTIRLGGLTQTAAKRPISTCS
jgi:hypothetical protein